MSDGDRLVFVKKSCPDSRLHGYCGKVLESRDGSFRIEFLINIRNEISEAWVKHVDVRPA